MISPQEARYLLVCFYFITFVEKLFQIPVREKTVKVLKCFFIYFVVSNFE